MVSPISALSTELWRSFPVVEDGMADSDLDAAGGGARGAWNGELFEFELDDPAIL